MDSAAIRQITRRGFLRGSAAVAALAAWSPSGSCAAEEESTRLRGFGLVPAGTLPTRPSSAIAASPLSIGYETLDRKLFEPSRTYAAAAQLGAKWARCQTGWARTETKPGQYDFGWLDEVVDGLLKIGIQPWFNLGYGNPLYSPGADETAVGWVPVFSATAMDGWCRYTEALAEHFRERVRHYEIWNEPNITAFWKPGKPEPGRYVELVKRTAPLIRERVPGAVIIGGAFSGIPMEYLRACLKDGMAELVDKLSYHPYRAVPEAGYDADVHGLRELLAQHGGGHVAIWQGENGCPSKKGGAGALRQADWNETRQAKWLLRRIVSDLRQEIELTSYYLIVDLVGYRGSTNWKGLLRGETYEPKQAYGAYRNLCALFDGSTRHAELPLQVAGGEGHTQVTAGFLRGGAPLYAYWRPADLMEDVPAARVRVTITDGDKPLAKPALLDPLDGRFYRIQSATRTAGGWTFEGLPLLDYPVIIADEPVFCGAAGTDHARTEGRKEA